MDTRRNEIFRTLSHGWRRLKNHYLRIILLTSATCLILFMGISPYFLNKPILLGYETVCPFGGLQGIVSLLTPKTSLKYSWSMALMALSVLGLAIVAGRAFCGNICPIGALQDFSHWIYRKCGGKKQQIPARIDSQLRWLKYFAFAGFFSYGIWFGTCVFRSFDPFTALNELPAAGTFSRLPFAYAILLFTVLGGAVFERLFCKYLCPLAPILVPFNRISVIKLSKDRKTCNSCRSCDRSCPMNIAISEVKSPQTEECISCHKCVTACKQGALKTRVRWFDSIPWNFGFVLPTLIVFLGSIAAGTFFGGFTWTPDALSASTSNNKTFVVTNIKSHHTFEEIVQVTGIPWELLRTNLGLKDEDLKKSIKNVAGRQSLTVTNVRMAVKSAIADTKKRSNSKLNTEKTRGG